jgi:hypothetical protein
MSELDQDLLQKVVGRMTSEHAGERAAAATKFIEALAKAGLSHQDIVVAKAPPSFNRGALNPVAEAERYMRESQELLAEQDLQASARNFVRVMDKMREDTRLLKYEIAVLQSFVSLEVIRIAKSRVEIETTRARDEAWRIKRGTLDKNAASYPTGPGGKPSWIKEKA